MGRKSKSKISTEHESALSLSNPFAGIGGLNDLPKSSSASSDLPPTEAPVIKSRGRVDVVREKSGRAGKTVTVLCGFSDAIHAEELSAMALKLKKHCACGGSLKERTIELQGDVCEQVMRELEIMEFKPVRCGG